MTAPLKVPRHVRMFKKRFVPAIMDGTKQQTARPVPERPILPGHILDLRYWSDKAFRSPQIKIWEAVVTRVQSIEITAAGTVILDGKPLGPILHGQFARADGFASREEMITWFKAEHTLPFTGIVIHWQH